jgi:small-conductance mechanosensitive channel
MHVQNVAKQHAASEKRSLEYYNAWCASEKSRAAIASDLHNIAREKHALEQEYQKALKENSQLSNILAKSRESTQVMARDYEATLARLNERLAQMQREKEDFENTVTVSSTSHSISPLSLDPSEETGERVIKRPKRGSRRTLN